MTEARSPQKRLISRDLVYQLLYPGVLGSMIFDLFDPLRELSLMKAALLLVALTFICDFYHISAVNLRERRDARPVVDAQIAVLYCFAYFALSSTTSERLNEDRLVIHAVIGLLFLAWAHVLISYYGYTLLVRREMLWEKAVPVVLFAVGAIVVGLDLVEKREYAIIGTLILGSGFYAWHVREYEIPKERDVDVYCDKPLLALSILFVVVWLVWARNSFV